MWSSQDLEQGQPGHGSNAYVDLPQRTTPLVEAVNAVTVAVSADQESPVPPLSNMSPCTATEPGQFSEVLSISCLFYTLAISYMHSVNNTIATT